MSDIRDRLNEFVRDHADFTIAVLALTILALCAVTWLWGRHTKQLRRLLAQERAANRAVLPAPSEAVMAVVASEAASRELDRPPEAVNREVERSGRAMYTVAVRPEETAEPAEPPAKDSLGWTLPAGAVERAAAASADAPAPSESAHDTQPDWAERRSPGSTDRASAPAAGPALWEPPSPMVTPELRPEAVSAAAQGGDPAAAPWHEVSTVREQPAALTTARVEPDATEPGATEPDATEPGATEPGTTEPDATEPGATEPDATEPDATAVTAPLSPSAEPHSAYVAWDAVMSWNRAAGSPDPARIEALQATPHADAALPGFAPPVSAPAVGNGNGASHATPGPDRAPITEQRDVERRPDAVHDEPERPSASQFAAPEPAQRGADGEAPDEQRAAFTPWTVTSEPIAAPPPLSPGPPPGSWAPAPAEKPSEPSPPGSFDAHDGAPAAPAPTALAPSGPAPSGPAPTALAPSDRLAAPDADSPAWYRPHPPAPEPPASSAPVSVPAPPTGAWTLPTQAPTPSPPADSTGTGSAIDILLVEDDENVSKVYRLLLESKGYGVRIASDGVAGLDEARLRRPDLVLLDVMMPRMNGILFLQALRIEPGLESVPVVILSNFKEPRLVERALALGALEYMVKAQTRPEALLNAIPRWVRRERAFAG